jgi:hypothetical protein
MNKNIEITYENGVKKKKERKKETKKERKKERRGHFFG